MVKSFETHVFGKYKVGFVSDPRCGGLILEKGAWLWFRANKAVEYSTDPYGVQDEA